MARWHSRGHATSRPPGSKRPSSSTALQSRDVIGQAKGILMERRGLDAGQAFDVLRSASQDLNVKLTEIAATLVERRGDL